MQMPELNDSDKQAAKVLDHWGLIVVPRGNNSLILIDLTSRSVTTIDGIEIGYLKMHTNFPQDNTAAMSVQLAGRFVRGSKEAEAAIDIVSAVERMSDAAGLPKGSVVVAFTGPDTFPIPVARGVRSSEEN
jgi:hypothetical protein